MGTLYSAGGGIIVQRKYTQTGAVSTGSTLMPHDDTIPQNTEGDEYMTVDIVPTNTANLLKIDVVFNCCQNGTVRFITAALFQDSTANALASATNYSEDSNDGLQISFSHFMSAGTTSSTTFKVRAGVHASATLTFNGQGGSRLYGGVMASSIVVTEYSLGTAGIGGSGPLGSWTTQTENTTYLAATDGFAMGKQTSGSGYVVCYTDTSNPPTTVRQTSFGDPTAGNTSNIIPVKKGEYWKVNGDSSNVCTVYWIPMGA